MSTKAWVVLLIVSVAIFGGMLIYDNNHMKKAPIYKESSVTIREKAPTDLEVGYNQEKSKSLPIFVDTAKIIRKDKYSLPQMMVYEFYYPDLKITMQRHLAQDYVGPESWELNACAKDGHIVFIDDALSYNWRISDSCKKVLIKKLLAK